jgi:Protein of unknown function (DUF1320).
MANWIILSGDNIRLLDSETVAMSNVTPLQDIDSCVLSASTKARSYVAGGGNFLEPSPAVPPEVVDDVSAIARYTYLAQEPSGTLLTPIRQKEYDDAMAHLRDIAKNIAAVTQGELPPDDVDLRSGKWGSATRIAMRTELVPPPPVP